jgi:hypothetical protein
MYLRTTQRKNTDGSVVRYVQLAHNHRVDGVTRADVLVKIWGARTASTATGWPGWWRRSTGTSAKPTRTTAAMGVWRSVTR